jgi:hypothetical protein
MTPEEVTMLTEEDKVIVRKALWAYQFSHKSRMAKQVARERNPITPQTAAVQTASVRRALDNARKVLDL